MFSLASSATVPAGLVFTGRGLAYARAVSMRAVEAEKKHPKHHDCERACVCFCQVGSDVSSVFAFLLVLPCSVT